MSLKFPVSLVGKGGSGVPTACNPAIQPCWAEALDPALSYLFGDSCNILKSTADAIIPDDWGRDLSTYKHLILGANVTTLGTFSGNCFKNSGLREVYIPTNVTSTKNYPFSLCSSLVKVTITGGMSGNVAYMFLNCTNLTRLNVCNLNPPSGYSSGGFGSFAGCPLTECHVPENATGFGATYLGLTVVKDLPAL